VVKELRREEIHVAHAAFGIIERQRVDGLYLEASNAAVAHHAHLALQLRLRHRRTEPPPAHHDARFVGRAFKAALQIVDAGGTDRRSKGREGEKRGEDDARAGEPEHAFIPS
jgi:hypothetical protein